MASPLPSNGIIQGKKKPTTVTPLNPTAKPQNKRPKRSTINPTAKPQNKRPKRSKSHDGFDSECSSDSDSDSSDSDSSEYLPPPTKRQGPTTVSVSVHDDSVHDDSVPLSSPHTRQVTRAPSPVVLIDRPPKHLLCMPLNASPEIIEILLPHAKLIYAEVRKYNLITYPHDHFAQVIKES
ncbi:hypothetical protein SEMRO_699_G189420.1 [Seminavis robusta]|uniref:Uncharacterized protein n=1 Tax=Seminavis robusta TaxID=568900 RepID=A0A9N8HHD5_9STRA|nr:hypothetical protein SEMRO_699_G189420.1 [Seminavis robusta]|eukprot:Sro699_g189420.1 n/a (180) ;mRNA; r:16463-17002